MEYRQDGEVVRQHRAGAFPGARRPSCATRVELSPGEYEVEVVLADDTGVDAAR